MRRLPVEGTDEHTIFGKLLTQMSRRGMKVNFEQCAQLAETIQEHGHKSGRARLMARDMGLDPEWLPRQRT